jgi:polynucleotide 5'-hydroxyl-kinase GRC3/NOL9
MIPFDAANRRLATGLDIDLPPGWEAAAAAVLTANGVVMVLGGPDCGKSTFCRLVLDRALAAGKAVAFIDGDLGQSHLGPPATLGLNLYPPHAPDDSGLFPDALYFIGQTSPPGKMLELVVGLHRLAEHARSRGHHRLIVNTSGFIGGPPALRLKLAKAETLEPHLCIGLQQQQELEPILAPLRQFCPQVLTLPVSSQAQPKLWPQRRRYRQERFGAYFAAARPQSIALETAVWMGFPFGQGEPWPLEQQKRLGDFLEAPVLHAEKSSGISIVIVGRRLTESEMALAGQQMGQERVSWVNWGNLELRLVGLLDADLLTLGLGLLLPSPWERRQIIIHTPLPSRLLDQVKFCRLGKIRLEVTGEEMTAP